MIFIFLWSLISSLCFPAFLPFSFSYYFILTATLCFSRSLKTQHRTTTATATASLFLWNMKPRKTLRPLVLPLLSGNVSDATRNLRLFAASESIMPSRIIRGTNTVILENALCALTFFQRQQKCKYTGGMSGNLFLSKIICNSWKEEPPDLIWQVQPATVVPQASPRATENPAPSTNVAVPLAALARVPPVAASSSTADVYGQAAYNLVAGNTLETTTQYLLDMDGGIWTVDMVVRALRAAYNNPARAVGYLYSGIPKSAEVPPVSATLASRQAVNLPPAQAPQAPVPASGPNANSLDLFPQGLPTVYVNANAGNLDFLLNSQQVLHFLGEISFSGLIAMYQNNDFGKDKSIGCSCSWKHIGDNHPRPFGYEWWELDSGYGGSCPTCSI